MQQPELKTDWKVRVLQVLLGVGYLRVSYWVVLVVKLVLSVWSNVNWLRVSCIASGTENTLLCAGTW